MRACTAGSSCGANAHRRKGQGREGREEGYHNDHLMQHLCISMTSQISVGNGH